MSEFTAVESLPAPKTVFLKESLNEGLPGPEHFDIVEGEPIDLDAIEEGSIVVQAKALSADPYLRGQIKSTGPIKGGKPVRGFIAGKVVASKNPAWVVGDLIGASLAFSTLQVVTATGLAQTVSWKLTGLIDESEISYGVGILGMPGATAYGGLIDVLRPLAGETIFISAASGAVGSLVGQIAKQNYGCKVIASVGGPSKCALVKEKFGFDHAIDYKTVNSADDLIAAIREVAPEGIDMYFENVGGIHFDAAFATLRSRGRIALCGGISEYNNSAPTPTTFQPLKMIYTQQRIEGFLAGDWLQGAKGNFLVDMNNWFREGKLQVQETVSDGIESWPLAFQSLFTGANVGKVVVRV